jgi:metacaspase-1
MVTINSINNEFKNNIDNLNRYYNYEYNRIIKLRIHPYYKRIYLQRLYNFYIEKVNYYKKIKDNKLKDLYHSLSNINNNDNFKALLVGINYRNTNSELRGCINDVISLKQYFIDNNNLKDNDIFTLTDDTSLKPTRNNILQKYKELLINSQKGDILYFTYSGHGSYTFDRNGDELDGNDELLVSLDHKGISDDELKQIADEYLKEDVTLFVLFDCCHSGTLLDLNYRYLTSNDYSEVITNNKNTETKGNIFFISGSSDSQTSADAYINNSFQGAMTWSFLESVKSKKDISWKNLLINMRELLKNRYTQIPQFSSDKNINIDSKIIF